MQQTRNKLAQYEIIPSIRMDVFRARHAMQIWAKEADKLMEYNWNIQSRRDDAIEKYKAEKEKIHRMKEKLYRESAKLMEDKAFLINVISSFINFTPSTEDEAKALRDIEEIVEGDDYINGFDESHDGLFELPRLQYQ